MALGIEVSRPVNAGVGPGTSSGGDALELEIRGWSSLSTPCAPKVDALSSLSQLPPPDPVASVSYRSRGNVLVLAGGDGDRARVLAGRLASSLPVTLLHEGPASAGAFATWSGRVERLEGYLGEFTVAIAGLARPGMPPASTPTEARFDLVLDCSEQSPFAMRQPPQGYFRAPAEDGAVESVLAELCAAVGEFEKPRFFAYRENLCAHSRSRVVGCTACIEACSTGAIAPDGDHVKVDPHLCMGCGTCSTVCPSGAMGYQYPRVAERGAQLKQLLATYRRAGGEDACIVFHNGTEGRELLLAAARGGQGLAARALPLETWSVLAIGLDLLLGAIAYGASQVVLLAAGWEDADERAALREQMEIGEAILAGLGRGGRHFALIEARDPEALASAMRVLEPAPPAAAPAQFMLSNDKRTAIEFSVEHLAGMAPAPVAEIALFAGAPYGEVRVDRDKCTLCMSCVGACPESALMDGVDRPLLKFVERNCVQCGLCEATCPEQAIALSPRLLLGTAAREARVLNEAQPFHCVSCGKAFGTRQLVESMLGRLSTHSMFSRPEALRRLQMCGDCRVVDLMSAQDEASVLKLGADS